MRPSREAWAEMVETYLDKLRAALVGAGADPALIQDALYDAEEYLRAEVARGGDEDDAAQAFERAVESFGAPEEVAAAYMETERTVVRALGSPGRRPARSTLGRFFGVVVDPRAYAAVFYLLLAFATGIVYFTVAVTGISLSIGLSILIIGIPVMLLFIAIVRAVSLVEGRIVEALLGERMPRRPRWVSSEGKVVSRIKAWLLDYRTWTTLFYMLMQLPLGVLYFSALAGFFSAGAALMAAPIAQVVSGGPVIWLGADGYLIEPWAFPLVWAAALFLIILTMHLVRAVGRLHAAYAKVMLVGRFSEE